MALKSEEPADSTMSEHAYYALATVGAIGRALNGNLPPGTSSAAPFVARLSDPYIEQPTPLLEAYNKLLAFLLSRLDATSAGGGQIAITRFMQAINSNELVTSSRSAPQPEQASTVDVQLTVLATARLLIEHGSDEDLKQLQNYPAEQMLPEAMTFLCWALESKGNTAETIQALTTSVLQRSLDS